MSLFNFKSQKPLIMVVDDDFTLLDMYETFLEALNCRVIKVLGSKQALAMAEKHKPQLILLDIIMPGLTGLQVLEGLKQKPSTKSIPVLMITAEQRVKDFETAFRLGAVDYMVKPTDYTHFEQKITALLSSIGCSLPGAVKPAPTDK